MNDAPDDITIEDQINEIRIIGMGVADWVQRAKSAQINRPQAEIERKQKQLEILRAVHRTLEDLKAGSRG